MKIQSQLILWHRYLGIATCLLFAMWFATGIVMMYVRMPSLTPQERMDALPPLDPARVRLSVSEAVAKAEIGTAPQSITLTSIFDQPVYRIQVPGGLVTVFADDGQVLTEFEWPEVVPSIRPFLATGNTRWHLDATLTQPDQWTLEGEMRPLFPMYRVSVDDGRGTMLYLSSITGDVVLKTTSRSRALAWAGAIPHWLYVTAIRKHGAFWQRLVIWVAGICCFTSTFGLVLGLSRYSPSRRFRSPYQGAKLWHHWGGLAFGLITLTWVFSGLLSMLSNGSDPTDAQVRAFTGGDLDPAIFHLSPASVPAGAKEVGFSQVCGKPLYAVSMTAEKTVLLDGRGEVAAPFSETSLIKAAGEAVPGAGIREVSTLRDYDWYYYDRDELLPLPVLRVKFNDPQSTWLYIDPARGALLARFERYTRLERWIYHGLHSWDFPFLWRHRPWWDAVVILLLTGGLLVSITAVVMGASRVLASFTKLTR